MIFSKYIYIAAAVAILGLGLANWYLIERVGTLKGDLIVAVEANKEWQEKVEKIKIQAAKELSLRSELATELRGARSEAEEYKAKFAKHDLEMLARIKPGLVTKLMRRGTVGVLNDLEAAINRDTDLSGRTDIGPNNAVATPAPSDPDRGKTVGGLFDKVLRESLEEPSGVLEGD